MEYPFMENNKKSLRAHYKRLRQDLSEEMQAQYSALICAEILKSLPEKPMNIHLFLPMQGAGEVNLHPLLATLWERGDRLYIPRVKGKNLEHIHFTADTDLVLNRWQIPEPALHHPPASIDEISHINWVLTPLLVCDEAGYRVGYGGGFYDQFFQTFPQVVKIGVGFFAPITEISDRYQGDIPLNHYIMPGKKLTFEHR
ncbi:5-formyltetrahydrofolate cyclo-ligase [Ignatzschineria ureiclastica]|uniref:5-formyltetrahydrofolate cyclo-ligase n=2 Tax=Ignatzschineria ureiclastica TaxID=472582 RepID=A0A2U2AFD3_9GAMM|nr:5-formyltetrahydrofolate cyclo-ligase [Ignatzschineria ureiclastica]